MSKAQKDLILFDKNSLLFLTIPGLEEALRYEIKSRAILKPLDLGGVVFLETSNSLELLEKALLPRTSSGIIIPFIIEEIKDPRNIHSITTELRRHRDSFNKLLKEIYDPKKDRVAFRGIRLPRRDLLKNEKNYNHHFTSVDLARETARVLLDKSFKVDLKEPNIEIMVLLLGDILIIGWSLLNKLDKKRCWRRHVHHAALRPTAAASAIRIISAMRKYDVLYDPMCGFGTIPLENTCILHRVPIGADLGREKIQEISEKLVGDKYVGEKLIKGMMEKAPKRVKVLGSDISLRNIKLASENLLTLKDFLKNEWHLEIEDTTKFFRADIFSSEPPQADIIITNPPYGIRTTRPEAIPKLYRALAGYSYNTGAEIFAVFTPREEILIGKSKDFWEPIKHYKTLLGDLKVDFLVLKRK